LILEKNSKNENYFVEAKSLVALFRLNIADRYAFSRMGERVGRQRGSSIDFQEHRTYFLGDDIRFIDWAASARTDQLLLKTFHEEISPILEIYLDCSLSMAVTSDKWWRSLQVLFFIIELSKSDNCLIKVYLLGVDSKRLHELHEKAIERIIPQGVGLECVLKYPIPLQPNAIRIIISDFMIGENLNGVLHALYKECSMGIGIRLLDLFEIDPTPIGGFRLTDSENGEEISLRITQDICDRYKERFEVHTKRIKDTMSRFNSKLITVDTQKSLKELIMSIHQQTGLVGFRQ